MAPLRTTPGGHPDVGAVQRRTVRTLAVAQVFSALGAGSTLALGSILAVDLSGDEAFAGTTTTALTLAPALLAVPLAGLALNRGRRVALSVGLAGATLGTLLIVAAIVWRVFPVLVLGAFLVGLATAVNLQARFAATDLARPERRGRDLSLVVWAVTVGAVAGPNMVVPGAALSSVVGLPTEAGPFLISGAGMVLGGLLLLAGLRPDPLLLRQQLDPGIATMPSPAAIRPAAEMTPAAEMPVVEMPEAATSAEAATPPGTATPLVSATPPGAATPLVSATPPRAAVPPVAARPGGSPSVSPSRPSVRDGWTAVRASVPARAALAMLLAAHTVMVAVMSMTPLHLQHLSGAAADGPGFLSVVGFTISLHVAGMFALSPVMGWAADRLGPGRTALAGLAILLGAVAVAGLGRGAVPSVTVGLVLLGLGWSATTVAGSALLVEAVPSASRVTVQGLSDASMSGAGAVGSLVAGAVMGWGGYGSLTSLTGVLVVLTAAGAAMALRAPARYRAAR